MDNSKSVFSLRIKDLRNENGYTQEEVIQNIGIESIQVLSNYENDRRTPDLDRIVKFAEFYNVTTDYLLGLSQFKNDANIDIKEQIGLSDISINVLRRWKEWHDVTDGQIDFYPGNIELKTLNYLLENIADNDIFKSIGIYLFSDLVTMDNIENVTLVNKDAKERITFSVNDIISAQLLHVQRICMNLREDIQKRKDNSDIAENLVMTNEQMFQQVKILNKMLGGETTENE